MTDNSHKNIGANHQHDDDSIKTYTSIFWWLFKYLVAASLVSAGTTWVLNGLSLHEWTIYGNVDSAWSKYFPGITNLSLAAASPPAWRLYLYLMTSATAFGCVKVGKMSWQISNSEAPLRPLSKASVALLAALVACINVWFVLFNVRPVMTPLFSRGAALLTVFHTSYIGLALTGWFFFFFIVICVALLAKLVRSYFGA